MRNEPSIPEWSSMITATSRLSLCVIDMQKFFITDQESPWANRDFLNLVPNITELIETIGPHRSLFTVFTPPVDWQTEEGSWRTYYYYNREVTTEVLGTTALQVIDELAPYVGNPAAVVAPKKTASAFSSPQFRETLRSSNALFLVMCGIETDYCVLASALDALNQGYYVVLPQDACASSKGAQGQRNAIGIYERFPEQIWLTDTKTLAAQLSR